MSGRITLIEGDITEQAVDAIAPLAASSVARLVAMLSSNAARTRARRSFRSARSPMAPLPRAETVPHARSSR